MASIGGVGREVKLYENADGFSFDSQTKYAFVELENCIQARCVFDLGAIYDQFHCLYRNIMKCF